MTKGELSYIDFLNNDKFVEWRLLQTEELNQYWGQYIIEHPESVDALNQGILKFEAVKLNSRKLPEENQNELYKNIVDNISVYERKSRQRKYYWFSAAASIVLLMVFSYHFTSKSRVNSALSDSSIACRSLPSDEVQLISDNKVVTVKSNSQIKLTQGGLASVNLNNGANPVNLGLSKSTMSKLIVPAGKRSFLLLADGTKVWLNSGTQLEFPSEFTGTTRDINVKGEIYIEVSKSKDKPFIVHTDEFNVQVYGTRFDISAYSDEADKSVVLVEGSVSVETRNHGSTLLSPNQMYYKNGEEIGKKTVDASEYISWIDGILIFRNASIGEVTRKIGRYYNVSFDCSKDVHLADKTCSGKLILSADLDSVMTSVSRLYSTTYTNKGKMIYLTNSN